MTKYDYIAKVVIIGDAAVGKTCLLSRFISDEFIESYQSTIGVDFSSRTMSIENAIIKVQIWDTAGQERFRSICRSYLRGVQAAILVYDVTKMQSFLNLETWVKNLEAENSNKIPTIIIGNKSDLGTERCVSWDNANNFALEHDMLYTETSALEGYNVEFAVTQLIKKALREDKLRKYESFETANPPMVSTRYDTRFGRGPKCSEGCYLF